VKHEPRKKLVDLTNVKHSSSPLFQMVGQDNWSHFGDHVRKDVKKKIEEQPRLNPVDPVKVKTGAGGQ
jgi:hypothetical protein